MKNWLFSSFAKSYVPSSIIILRVQYHGVRTHSPIVCSKASKWSFVDYLLYHTALQSSPMIRSPKRLRSKILPPNSIHSYWWFYKPHILLFRWMRYHEFASISAQCFFVCSFLSFAASRFSLVRSSLWALRHLLTLVFASLHMPTAFHMNPLAWHSSRSVITSSQAVKS